MTDLPQCNWNEAKLGSEILEHIAQRGGRFPIPGNIQDLVGWGSKPPGLVEVVIQMIWLQVG